MEREQAQFVAQKCREYVTATRQYHGYFVLGWIGAVALPFFATFQQTEIVLGIAIWIVVVWGALPRWSMRDRTEDYEFLCPKHIHVYFYYPGDKKQQACYTCLCGKTEIAREPTGSE